MFIRVSSLRCAWRVDTKPCVRLLLPRPSTRCGLVNQHEQQVVEDPKVVEVGEVVPLRCNLPNLQNLHNLPNLL